MSEDRTTAHRKGNLIKLVHPSGHEAELIVSMVVDLLSKETTRSELRRAVFEIRHGIPPWPTEEGNG